MKKILLAGLIASSMFASTFPNYKASMGVSVGTSTVNTDVSSGTTNISEKSNQIDYGLYFSMEEKFSGTHFYYGMGFDFEYLSFEQSFVPNELTANLFSLYPSLGYNFSKDFSIKAFGGLNYLDVQTDIQNQAYGNSDLGFVYGASMDYSLGTSVTNGIVYKKNLNTLGIADLGTDTLMYRIGIKF